MCVFDRSWYGRVLVERVEEFATREEWMRAYDEIVQFERGLVMEGVIVVKFWMQVSQDEQLKRFESRRDDPLRSWKLNDEDWRNRDKWPQYVDAIEDMFAMTDHDTGAVEPDRRRTEEVGSGELPRDAERARRRGHGALEGLNGEPSIGTVPTTTGDQLVVPTGATSRPRTRSSAMSPFRRRSTTAR